MKSTQYSKKFSRIGIFQKQIKKIISENKNKKIYGSIAIFRKFEVSILINLVVSIGEGFSQNPPNS